MLAIRSQALAALGRRTASAAARASSSTSTVFPREREGNVYAINWSLTEDGVVPVGDAFRNARVPLLATRLSAKVENGKVDVGSKVAYTGKYNMLEAGEEGLSHGAFSDKLAEQQAYLSSGIELFVEDAALGAFHGSRVGVRVVTDSSAVALIARTLLIPVPERPVDHRARFDGWNLDPRWEAPEIIWTGEKAIINDKPTTPQKGQRPIVAFIGGPGEQVAVQFVEASGRIVGANISIGGAAPVRAMIDAIGHASSVLINAQSASSVALQATTLVKGASTVVVVSADDSIVDAANANGTLFGAYHSSLSSLGVSALWNGAIAAAPASPRTSRLSPPVVVSSGKAAVAISPNNLAAPATSIVFFEKGGRKGVVSEDDAIKRLTAATDDAKIDAIKALVKGVKLASAGSMSDIDL